MGDVSCKRSCCCNTKSGWAMSSLDFGMTYRVICNGVFLEE